MKGVKSKMKLIDILVILILAGFIALAIRYMIKNKKAGKSIAGCSRNCAECAMRNCEKRQR